MRMPVSHPVGLSLCVGVGAGLVFEYEGNNHMNTLRRFGIASGAALLATLGWSVLTRAAALDTTSARPITNAPLAIAITADDATSSTITSTTSITRANPVAVAISSYYTLPVSQVVALHNSGYGYGEIVKLYQFALVSGKAVSEVQQMRDSGMGWGQISKMLNLPRGVGKVTLGSIMRARKKAGAPDQVSQTGQPVQSKRLHKRGPNAQSVQNPAAVRKVKPKVVKPKGNGNANRVVVKRIKPRVTAPKRVNKVTAVKPVKAKRGR
jgi:hypothetical protein